VLDVEDADIAHWRECSFRYRRADGSCSRVLTLPAMQAAIMKGNVAPHTDVEITAPGEPPEAFELLGEALDGYDGLGAALIPAGMVIPAGAAADDQLQKLFDEFDTDHDGSLDVAELRRGLTSLNIDVEHLDDLVAAADANGDGRISPRR
jgi:hypothetical protein